MGCSMDLYEFNGILNGTYLFLWILIGFDCWIFVFILFLFLKPSHIQLFGFKCFGCQRYWDISDRCLLMGSFRGFY
jgi:hypothetical protein